MLICALLLVSSILPSTNGFKREILNLSDASNTDENFVRDTNESVLRKVEKEIDLRDAGHGNVFKKHVIAGGSKKELENIHRKKRQLSSIISGVLHLTGLGLTLAQTLTGGCLYYPSICRDKERMEDLERRLVPMRSEYNKLYLDNKKEFLDILTTNTNNGYITYYINDTLKNINSLQELETILSAKLESKFPNVYAKYKDAEYYTSEEYLDTIVGHLQYRVSYIQNLLNDQKKTQLKRLLIGSLVGIVINTFVSSYSKAYKQVMVKKRARIFYKKITQMAAGTYIPGKKVSFRQKAFSLFKHTKQALKIVAKSPYTFGKKIYSMFTKGTPPPSKPVYSQTKLKKLQYSVSKLSSKTISAEVKLLATDRKHNTAKPKGISKMNLGMGVLAFFTEAVSQVVSAWEWGKIAKTVKKQRKKYEIHYAKFLKELKKVKNETVELGKPWPGIILDFKNTTSIFQTLIEGAKNNTIHSVDVGNPKLSMNTSNPIYNINFQTLNRNNIQSAQKKVLNFIKDTDFELMVLVDKMNARNIMYEKVLKMTDSNKSIDDIFDSITGILKFSQSKTVKEFGTLFTKKDLTCTISLICLDRQEYDFFPLGIFRPTCNLSIDEYTKNEQFANKLRNEHLLNGIIIKTLTNNQYSSSLVDLTESIKNAYFGRDNNELSRYGSRITEKDVICSIATLFPSKQEYDFISLIPFRSNCETVDEKTFKKMKAKAETVKGISLQINSLVNTCKLFKFCPCPSIIANMFGISIEKVINLLRLKVGPHMEKYCGTPGCSCVALK